MLSRSIWTTLKRATNIDPLAHGLTVAAGISLFAMMIMMTIHVFSRKMGLPVPGAFEVSEQLMVVVFTFPLAEISLKKDHVVFELFSKNFPSRFKRRMDIVGTFVGLFVFAPLTYKAWELALKMYAMGEYRQGMIDIPIWPFRLMLAIGLSVFTYQLVASWIRAETEIWSKGSAEKDADRAGQTRIG